MTRYYLQNRKFLAQICSVFEDETWDPQNEYSLMIDFAITFKIETEYVRQNCLSTLTL